MICCWWSGLQHSTPDLMVWQPAVDPALLGHSCVDGASPSTVMLHVAFVNDPGLGLPQKRMHELVDDMLITSTTFQSDSNTAQPLDGSCDVIMFT